MKPVALALAIACSLFAPPALAQDGPLVLVVDDDTARVDAAALRRDLAAATGRTVIRLADARAIGARDTLSLASVDGSRWVLRYDHGDASRWRAEDVARPDALRSTLIRASRDMLQEDDWARAASDVLDPFAASTRWDPLRDALRMELLDPFSGRTRYSWTELVDPFAPPAAWVDLMDPWAGN